MTLRMLTPAVLLLALAGAPVTPSAVPLPFTPAANADRPSPTAFQACEIPIRWRIADVDPRFGLTEDDAARAVREAGILWEAAVGRVLMFQESSDGIPVRFIFDERQEMTLERQQREMAIGTATLEVEQAQRELDRLTGELDRLRRLHENRSLTFEERRASYQELVDYWNRQGGAPPEELERLRETERELETYRMRANEAAEEVNEMVDRVNRETDVLNEAIAELNEARRELEVEFQRMTVESAHYRDERTGFGRLILSRDREIQVFQFEDRDHLIMVIAHELGHALGLEHSGVEGSLMAESAVAVPGQGPPEVTPADVRQLRELCPEI